MRKIIKLVQGGCLQRAGERLVTSSTSRISTVAVSNLVQSLSGGDDGLSGRGLKKSSRAHQGTGSRATDRAYIITTRAVQACAK